MSCGKSRYPDKRAAQTARNERLQSRHNRPDFLRIYACPACHGWHLTSARRARPHYTRPRRRYTDEP